MTDLVRYDAMCLAIAECHRVDEVKDLRDKAMALELYAKQARNTDAERKASEVRLRAERRMGELLNDLKRARAVEVANLRPKKDAFISIARAAFVPSARKACAVCGRYEALTQAHHVVPLAMQFDRGYEAPDHEHEWLCPTHHAAVHVLIGQNNSRNERASKACIAVTVGLGEEELRAVLVISTRAWQSHANALRAWGNGRRRLAA